MNKRFIIFLCSLIWGTNCAKLELGKSDLSQDVRSSIKILLATNDINDWELEQCTEILKSALVRSNQFEVIHRTHDCPKTKKEITEFFDLGYSMVIFLNQAESGKAFEWRLYDTTEAIMVKGKKIYKRGPLLRGWAYSLADDIWLELTNSPNSFSSKIAYVKCKKNNVGRQQYVVNICDYDGSNETQLISAPGIYVGLHWHPDPDNLCLFCSEFTRTNARFISVNASKNKRTLFNFEGTCVGISLSKDSNKAVYCRSGNIWSYRFDQSTKRSYHKDIIKNDGKNINPTMLENSDIIFCSDAPSIIKKQGKRCPQICYYNASDKSIKQLTKEGYCVGPSYCKTNNKICYSKKLNGIMQLFIYDLNNNQDQQITFDDGNKTDSSFSPCGNFILFCYQKGKISQIMSLNIATKKRYSISKPTDSCSSPAWSCSFNTFPSIV